jgi:hypothetical protein
VLLRFLKNRRGENHQKIKKIKITNMSYKEKIVGK